MQDRVQVWGSMDWFYCRVFQQRHLRISALAPQLFAAVAGITKQLQIQNVSERKLLGVLCIFSHVFRTYKGKRVWVYLNCLVGSRRSLLPS